MSDRPNCFKSYYITYMGIKFRCINDECEMTIRHLCSHGSEVREVLEDVPPQFKI